MTDRERIALCKWNRGVRDIKVVNKVYRTNDSMTIKTGVAVEVNGFNIGNDVDSIATFIEDLSNFLGLKADIEQCVVEVDCINDKYHYN